MFLGVLFLGSSVENSAKLCLFFYSTRIKLKKSLSRHKFVENVVGLGFFFTHISFPRRGAPC